MSRERYRVLAVAVAEAHEAETIYRVQLRHADHMEPKYVLLVSQSGAAGEAKEAPYDVGGTVVLDPRLVDRE